MSDGDSDEELDTSPGGLLSEAEGKSINDIAKQGFGAWLLAVAASAITGVQTVFNVLVVVPLEVMATVMRESAAAFLIEPFGVIESGAQTTSGSLDFFGIFALPASVVIVLLTLAAVGLYLSQRSTSDVLPGTFTDFLGDLLGTEEEGER